MFWETLRTDLRHALRLAGRTPLFTTLTILALALGIGATSAIFAVVNGVLLRPLAVRDPDRVVTVMSYAATQPPSVYGSSPANFMDLRRETRAVSQFAAFSTSPFSPCVLVATDDGIFRDGFEAAIGDGTSVVVLH